MGGRERQNVLLRLQDTLMAGGAAASGASTALPFQVGSATYALAFSEVQRVQLLSGMVALTRYPQVPPCVIGVAGSESEMLTVVDAGLLLGYPRVPMTMKSRLVVMGEGAMKGFGLMVARVLELVQLPELDRLPDCTLVTSKSLSEALHSQVDHSTESRQ
jgi:chemotaxis signal transduction protein